MDEDEKEGREEVCVCVVRWRACAWVCDKVSDDVMNKDERDERERGREGGGERSLEALDFAIRSA